MHVARLNSEAVCQHRERQQRLQRFADATARHEERIRAQRANAQVAMLEKACAVPAPLDEKAAWMKRQFRLFEKLVASDVIAAEVAAAAPKPIDIAKIQIVVAKHYEVSRIDMISARRTWDLVRPRQVAMYLAKTLTLRSLPDIGRRFGSRDHTTVLHAVRKFERLIASDPVIAATVEKLKAAILA